jgi:hypothetical protein
LSLLSKEKKKVIKDKPRQDKANEELKLQNELGLLFHI